MSRSKLAFTNNETFGVDGKMSLNFGSNSWEVMMQDTSVSVIPWINAPLPRVAYRVTIGIFCFIHPLAEISHSALVSAHSTTFSLAFKPNSLKPRPKLPASFSVCLNVLHWKSPKTNYLKSMKWNLFTYTWRGPKIYFFEDSSIWLNLIFFCQNFSCSKGRLFTMLPDRTVKLKTFSIVSISFCRNLEWTSLISLTLLYVTKSSPCVKETACVNNNNITKTAFLIQFYSFWYTLTLNLLWFAITFHGLCIIK